MSIAGTNTQNSNAIPRQSEWVAFRILSLRLVDDILNRIFALTIQGSRQRRIILAALFLLAGLLLYLTAYNINQWRDHLQAFFSALLTNQPSLEEAITPLTEALFNSQIIRLLPVLALPFFLSLHFASRYLADIFHLDDVGIARKFISEVSLGGADNTLTIGVDEQPQEDINKSPLYMIGGPGRVTVKLGTAILVEKPDGYPRIIGPTHYSDDEEEDNTPIDPNVNQHRRTIHPAHPKIKLLARSSSKGRTRNAKEKNILEGFERIRDIIDLRVQIPNALEITARSRDGIPIKILDARVIYSVFRGKGTPTVKEPYPYTPEAIHALIYKETRPVIEEKAIFNQKIRSPREIALVAMKSLLRRELSKFMSQHDLGEYLASIGEPEANAIEKIEQEISAEKQKLSGSDNMHTPSVASASGTTPRSELSRLFKEFNGKFNKEQQQRGIEAQWVGVGTWKMPPGIPENVIPQKHLAAWLITLENIKRGSEQELKELEMNAEAEQLQRLIQQTPINVFRDGQNSGNPAKRVIMDIISAYWQQWDEAIEILSTTNRKIAPSIIVAYYKIQQSFFHPPDPDIPEPASAREKRLYEELERKLGIQRVSEKIIPRAIEKLIELERRFAPDAGRADLLETIIKAWDADLK